MSKDVIRLCLGDDFAPGYLYESPRGALYCNLTLPQYNVISLIAGLSPSIEAPPASTKTQQPC